MVQGANFESRHQFYTIYLQTETRKNNNACADRVVHTLFHLWQTLATEVRTDIEHWKLSDSELVRWKKPNGVCGCSYWLFLSMLGNLFPFWLPPEFQSNPFKRVEIIFRSCGPNMLHRQFFWMDKAQATVTWRFGKNCWNIFFAAWQLFFWRQSLVFFVFTIVKDSNWARGLTSVTTAKRITCTILSMALLHSIIHLFGSVGIARWTPDQWPNTEKIFFGVARVPCIFLFPSKKNTRQLFF